MKTLVFNSHLKQNIFNECINILNKKGASLSANLLELTDELKNDTKSSMGDKHETSRAMNQLEQEKVSNQITELNKQINSLQHININLKTEHIVAGSLIETTKGIVFVSVGLGKIDVDGNETIVISPQSPLGISFLNKKVGDEFSLNGNSYCIKKIV